MENVTNETVQTIEAYNIKADKLWTKVYNLRELIKDIYPRTIDKDSEGEYKTYSFESDDMYKRKVLADALKSEMYSVSRELERLADSHREIYELIKD